MSQLRNEFDLDGFTTSPLISEDLKNSLLAHISGYIREIGAPYSTALSLEEIADSIPDEIWAKKMTRAMRIFPSFLSKQIHQSMDRILLKEFERKNSAVNVIYPQEIETNPQLKSTDIAIYWRCVRPGKPDAGRPHRDASFWALEFKEGYDPKIPFSFNYLKDCIKIWIPLQGCISTTTLQVIPRSHKMEVPTTVDQTEYGRRPNIAPDWLKAHESEFVSPRELSEGSCIIFDMNLIHRGPPHNNTKLRISAELNYIVD